MHWRMMRRVAGLMAVLGGLTGGPGRAAETGGPATCNLLPNGSFERWDRSQARAPHINEEAFRENPWAPKRWHLGAPNGTLWLRSEEAHTGRYALQSRVPPNVDPVAAHLRYVELVPGATYTFGVWVAGTGRVDVVVMGKALEGDQSLAIATGAAGVAWQHIGGSFKAPAHLRLVALTLRAHTGDVRLDDAHLSTELDRPHDVDAVLNDKYGSDADTLLMEDFDGPKPAIKLTNDRAHITGDKAGRFGRGVRIDKVSGGTIPLTLDAMPPEGTLEFWMRPDAVDHQMVVLKLFPLLQCHCGGSLAWLWPCWGAPDQRTIHAFNADWQSWQPVTLGRMGSNQWFHTAITWDTNCVRTYVDGALVEMIVRPKLAWAGAPTHIELSTPMHWCTFVGVIDEIRLSKTRRYGPVVPHGAVYTTPPMTVEMAPVAGDANALSSKSPAMTTPEDRLAERAKLPGTVPDSQPGVFEAQPAPDGAYVYEAATAKPLVTGARCDLVNVGNLTNLQQVTLGAGVGRAPDELVNQGCYWRVGAVQPGRYWINVLFQSGGAIEAAQDSMVEVAVYLNGRMVQRSTHGDPVQVARGLWLIEAQAAADEAVKPGDEIAVVRGRGQDGVVRVVLRKQPLPAGPYRMPGDFGGHQWNLYTTLRVNTEATFVDAGGRPLTPARQYDYLTEVMAPAVDALLDTQGLARVVFTLVNPLPVAVTVEHDFTVTSYHREEAGRDSGRLTLQPHEKVLRTVRFAWKADEPAYTAEGRLKVSGVVEVSGVRVQGSGGTGSGSAHSPLKPEPRTLNPEPSLPSLLGWPERETYSFFPGHRQTLPWQDPSKDRVLRRAVLAAARVDGRDTLQLDAASHTKVWERAFTTDLNPPVPAPATLVFEPAGVPMSWGWTRIADMQPRPHGAYLRRKFTLPAALGDRSFRLLVTEATDEATAYVNGVRVGNVRGGSTPLTCDITRAVRPGTNELTIVVRDLIAIMDPAYVNTNAPVPNTQYLDAPGLFSAGSLGLASVSIESAPSVTVEDAFAIPSVRKGQMAARLTVANRRKEPVAVRVKATVLDAGKPVLELGEQTLRLQPDAPVEIRLERAWKNPRMWGPDDPHLYVLAVETTDAATGARLDYRRERFGFREVWIDGPHIRFNGEAISPSGAGMLTRLFENVGHRIGRFPLQDSPDYADEAGIPSGSNIHELRNTPSQHNVDRDVFWQAAESNCLASARLQQNHPSIVMWEMSNEWLCYLDYSANDPAAGARRFKRLSDAVRAADPTRFTHFSAEGDLMGLLDNHSFHYMYPYFDTTGFGMQGHTPYFPDETFWRPLDRHLRPDESVPASPHRKTTILRPSEKVIMDTEYLWKSGDAMWPPGLSRIVGEEDVLSTGMDAASGSIAWMWKTLLDGHRDLGVAPVIPYPYLTGVQRGAYLPRALIMPENQRRVFAGRTETRRYTLINGLFRPANMTLRWTLKGPDGKTLAKGKDARRFAEEKIQRGELSFKLPNVKVRTVCTLAATLESDGAFICGEEWDIEVWPDVPVLAGSLARKVLLFEQEGSNRTSNTQRPTSNVQRGLIRGPSASALASAGVPYETISDLSAPSTVHPPPSTLLILAEDALTTSNAMATAALGAFVEAGGRVLVLRQSVSPAGLPVTTQLEPRHWASQVFVRMGSHPVMQGLGDMDLHFWQPDRTVGLGAYTKPFLGTAITLADSGAVGGMERVHLMEIYRGAGLYLLCQLPVVARSDVEPMARELLARMVRYAAGTDAFCQPTNTLTVVAAADSPVAKRLAEIGAKTKNERPTSNAQRPTSNSILVDAEAGRGLSSGERTALAARLLGGATVVVVGVTPADTNWLSALAGTPVRVTVQPYSMWEGRGWRRGWPRLTVGLSLLDLYWKRYDADERANGQIEDPKRSIEPLQEFSVQAATGTELVFPGALVEVSVGKGRLVLDQRRWTTSHKELRRLADRQLSALLTGLNVAIVPPPPPREMPREVAYRTIDLTPYANRSLADDVAEDGKGSWNDQGAACDLRALPTGRQNFQGIPFLIGEGPLNCILLANQRKGGDTLPREVALPLGYAVEGLYFLHTSAWTAADGTEILSYRVEYADGTAISVPVRGGVSIYDWIGPKPFLNETGTRSATAWTGSCGNFPVIAVYRMLWVNPRPEAVVQRVVCARPTLVSLPVLIGVTAAVDKNAVAVSAEAAAKAAALFAQGRTAAAKGDLEAARTALKQALELDPAQPEAYRLLADVCERKGGEDWLLDAYGLWMRSGPRSPLPWNRTGEILEKRRNLQGALEAYKKSLAIEWNQPPVMDAVRRLEGAGK